MKARTWLRVVFGFFSSCATSRLAWLFACLHAAWFFLAIANMSPPARALGDFLDNGGSSTAALLAGRPFHFHYESVSLQLMVLADMPSMLAGALLTLLSLPLLANIHVGHYAGSYFGAGLLLLLATFQWLAVGKTVQTRLSSKSWGAVFLRTLDRCFAVAVILILSVTVVSVPVVNKRSQRLGFRHPAISFQTR